MMSYIMNFTMLHFVYFCSIFVHFTMYNNFIPFSGYEMTESLEGGSLGPHYTVPGILHYLQHEFTSYELDKIRWEDERAALKVTKRCGLIITEIVD